jgi:Na+-driven multidrug efflux pump
MNKLTSFMGAFSIGFATATLIGYKLGAIKIVVNKAEE